MSATSLTLIKLETLSPSSTSITSITLDDVGYSAGGGSGGGSGHPFNPNNPLAQLLEGSSTISGYMQSYNLWLKQYLAQLGVTEAEQQYLIQKLKEGLPILVKGGIGAGLLLGGAFLYLKSQKNKNKKGEVRKTK